MPKADVTVAGAQFYVTHCVAAESVLNNPGYTVRAASVTDPASLEEALRYPPYELPMGLWPQAPAPGAAPRRLARTKHPRGVWVAHSAYLPHDATGRDRSYFSHLLRLPAADPVEVLRSWGSSGWVTEYPAGAPKVIPRTTQVPVGLIVNDAALVAFLGPTPPAAAELSVAVCPWRLRGSVEARREQLARLVLAVLVLTEGQDNRLFVHAEPGLLALLLYGAVRILPADLVGDLTFSTFEPYHCNLRDFKSARVVGTYLGVPEKNLADLAGGPDLVLDTFDTTCSSAELGEPLPEGLNDLIQLVVTGNWTLLDEVHRIAGGGWNTRAWLVESGERVRAALKPTVAAPEAPTARDPWLADSRAREAGAPNPKAPADPGTRRPASVAPVPDAPEPPDPEPRIVRAKPAPVPAPARVPERTPARKKVAAVLLDEEQIEEDDDEAPRSEKKGRKKEKSDKPDRASNGRAGGGNTLIWLLVGGGLLLFVAVGVVVGVFALRGGKPKDTVQQKEDAPATPPDGPKPPKDKPTDPANQPNPVANAVELKALWSVNKTDAGVRHFDLDADGRVLVGVWNGSPWSMTAYDARTGAFRHGLEGIPDRFHRLFPLEKGKVGFQFSTNDRPPLTVWDTLGGGGPRVPPVPELVWSGPPSVNVSPNERYVALGAPEYRPGVETAFAKSLLQVIDVVAKRDALAIDWQVGTTVFTADSSRILVVDNTGRFRWFKLSDGSRAGEWTFGLKAKEVNAQEVSISADGRVILYYGQPPGKELTHHILDGATGNVLYSFPANRYLSDSGSVSDDGRQVVLRRNDGVGTSHTVEVLDTRGRLLAHAKFPKEQGNGTTRVRVNWKSRTLVVQERVQKITAYDLPAPGGP